MYASVIGSTEAVEHLFTKPNLEINTKSILYQNIHTIQIFFFFFMPFKFYFFHDIQIFFFHTIQILFFSLNSNLIVFSYNSNLIFSLHSKPFF